MWPYPNRRPRAACEARAFTLSNCGKGGLTFPPFRRPKGRDTTRERERERDRAFGFAALKGRGASVRKRGSAGRDASRRVSGGALRSRSKGRQKVVSCVGILRRKRRRRGTEGEEGEEVADSACARERERVERRLCELAHLGRRLRFVLQTRAVGFPNIMSRAGRAATESTSSKRASLASETPSTRQAPAPTRVSKGRLREERENERGRSSRLKSRVTRAIFSQKRKNWKERKNPSFLLFFQPQVISKTPRS